MKPRTPQLALRLDAAAPESEACWTAGATVVCLGERLTLVLDTACPLPERIGAELHLPLPPAATSRQIRDAAESWLRDEALRRFSAVAAQMSALAGRRAAAPRIVLSFGKRGDWARLEGDQLRCHWRLIEQAPAIVDQVIGQALAVRVAAAPCDDLFALA